MNKDDFLKMMVQDNETQPDKIKKIQFAEVIDCMDIALSQSPNTVDIASDKNLKDAFALIVADARKSGGNCCGPFRAAEVLAKYLGVKYTRATKKFASPGATVNLEDYL